MNGSSSKRLLPPHLQVKCYETDSSMLSTRSGLAKEKTAQQIIDEETEKANEFNQYLSKSLFDRSATGRIPTIADPWHQQNWKVKKYLEAQKKQEEEDKKKHKKEDQENAEASYRKWMEDKRKEGAFKKKPKPLTRQEELKKKQEEERRYFYSQQQQQQQQYEQEQRYGNQGSGNQRVETQEEKERKEKEEALKAWSAKKEEQKKEEERKKKEQREKADKELEELTKQREEKVKQIKEKEKEHPLEPLTVRSSDIHKPKTKTEVKINEMRRIQKILISPYCPKEVKSKETKKNLKYLKKITSAESISYIYILIFFYYK